MKIAVCMKQVPAISDGEMDEKRGVIIRNGTKVVNLYDMVALEFALQLKDRYNAEIDVFSMGPKSAEEVIKTAYASGADRGYLISDKAFAGADVLATAYTLYQGIASIGTYDIILCGKQTTDGDTAQVSGALSKLLQSNYVNGIVAFLGIEEEKIKVKQQNEEKEISWLVPMPCVMAIEREMCIPRLPSLKQRLDARNKEVKIIRLIDCIDQNISHYGSKGSATQVKKIYEPTRLSNENVIDAETIDVGAFIVNICKDRGVL